MKKVDWERVRDFIFDLCFIMLQVFVFYSLTMFAIYLNDKSVLMKIFMLVGFGIVILSILGMVIIPIIDFICNRKKCKKTKCVQPKDVIWEDIVV